MKKIIAFVSFLLLCASSTTWAINLSLNQSRFLPGDSLSLTLTEDWAGKADIYVAVTLPDESLFFLTPQNFVLDFVPYAVDKLASGSSVILQLDNLPVLPIGEYVFSAAMFQSGSFFEDFEITSTSLIFAAEAEPVDIVVGDSVFPDGMIGRSYSFALVPSTGVAPFQFSLSEGALPDGLTLGASSGLIQGTPSDRGFADFKVQVIDAQGNTGEIEGAIKVFGELSFGKHGTYKGCNGLQMAFNSVQDLDEIRIEKGTYECNDLSIPSSKSFEHGIKVSGGWDSSFVSQSDDAAVTVFDGKEEGRILSVSVSGSVAIEGLSFQNASASAINGNEKVSITNCVFTDNSASNGGAVYSVGNITNSTFTNNSASDDGGAVYYDYSSSSSITNSTFTNNSASDDGGAVYYDYSDSSISSITNSTFTNNSAYDGGAVSYYYDRSDSDSSISSITNSTFTNNSAFNGGAVSYDYYHSDSSISSITNSTFTNNSASNNGGAIYSDSSDSYSDSSDSSITNSTFTNNSASENGGAVYYYDYSDSSITNSTFSNNSASGNGGAVYYYDYDDDYSSSITNSTFTKNTASGWTIYGRNCTIVNSTIANNNGGGFKGSGTILNTIFAQNKVGDEANDITPDGEVHVNYTLVNNITGEFDFGAHNIMGEPRFVDADNGNFRLRSDSPAIDVGDSSVIESYTFLKDDAEQEIDLDGNPRIVGGAIDLGAFEVQ